MIKIANRQIFIFFFDFLNKNMGPSNISEMFGRCRQTVDNVIKRVQQRVNLANKEPFGRSKLLASPANRLIVQKTAKMPIYLQKVTTA